MSEAEYAWAVVFAVFAGYGFVHAFVMFLKGLLD